MHAFSVAPFDQNLSIDGKILSDDCATLGTLGVIPESVILLKVGHGSLPEEFWKVLMVHTHVQTTRSGGDNCLGSSAGCVSDCHEFLVASGFSISG